MYKPIQNPTQLEFPIWCLNDELAQILKEVQKSMSTDLAGVAINFIVICGGLIGAQYFAEIKKGYKVNSNLFLFNIGASGTGKSVVTGYFMKHVSKLEHKINLNQKERTELYIGSCTFEQLIELIYHSDQGIISFRDEAIGHFAEIGMYSSTGGDAQKALYNQAYSGTEYKRSTKKSGTITLKVNTITSVMNSTPDSIIEILPKADLHSGFLQRILFFNYSPAINLYTEAEISLESDKKVYNLFESLVHNRATSETNIPLDSEAKKLWISWDSLVVDQMKYNVYGIKHFDELLSKHKPTPVKIAATLLHIDNAMGNSRTKIDAELMTAGIKITEYLIAHTAYTWELFSGKKRSKKNDPLALALINVLEQMRTEQLIESAQVKNITKQLNRFVHDQLGINNKYEANVVGSKLKSLGLVPEKKTPGMFYYIDMNVLAEAKSNL